MNQENNESKTNLDKQKAIIKNNIITSTNKILRRVTSLSGMPESIHMFLHTLKRTYLEMKGLEYPSKSKTVGIFCVMVPEELIYAAGAIPVKLCSGLYAAASIGEDITPRDACPLVKASIGISSFDILPIYNNCEKFIVPTSCDCKRKMAYEISKFKPVIPLHIPSSRYDDRFVNNFVKDLYALKNTMENMTGNKVKFKHLQNSTKILAKAHHETYRLLEIQKNHPSVIKGSHVMVAMNSYAYEHVEKWTHAMELLNSELEIKLRHKEYATKPTAPRILLTGSPIVFPNIKVPVLIEESGGVIVAEETCMGTRRLYDPAGVNDTSFSGLIRSLATKYLLPCTCPTFVQNKQRLFKLKQMVEDFKVDGIIYHVLRGCQVYDFEYKIVEDEIRKLNIPILRLESDYNEEDIEQLRIRLEAFIEMIKYKDI